MATVVSGVMKAALRALAVDVAALDRAAVGVGLLLLELPQPASASRTIARTANDGLRTEARCQMVG